MGGAADACGMDSGEYTAHGGDVGAGFDEDAVFSAQALPGTTGKMFCDECFGALAGTDSACLQVQKVEQESIGGEADHRDYSRAVEGGGLSPFAVAASDGFAGDARGEGSAG